MAQRGNYKEKDGTICWYEEDGTKYWYDESGYLHRECGPAIAYAYGKKKWYIHGKLHRRDGPAIELANGYKIWYYHDELINCRSQEEFERMIKMKAFW